MKKIKKPGLLAIATAVLAQPSHWSTRYNNCVETSTIPSRGIMQLTHNDGTVVHLRRVTKVQSGVTACNGWSIS